MLKSWWIHSKDSYFLSYCSVWWNELWSETCKTVQNPEPPFAGVLQDRIFQKLLNSQKYTCVWVSFIIRLQVNFASEQFMSNCSYRTITDNGFWKWKSFFPSKLIIKVKPIDSHWFKMSCLTCLIFSCVYCFSLKRWNYIKIFVLHE